MFKDDKPVISELMIENEPWSGALHANNFNEQFLRGGVPEPLSTEMAVILLTSLTMLYPQFICSQQLFWNKHSIAELKNNYASGIDQLKPQANKAGGHIISQPLSHI